MSQDHAGDRVRDRDNLLHRGSQRGLEEDQEAEPDHQRRDAEPRRDADAIVRNLTDLNVGAPVVHEDHGVGRYLGLTTLEAGGITAEFVHLEYADGDKLYVPVHALELISRYTGASPENAPLHRLGSDQWEKARRRAIRRIRDVAAELLDVYARRAARPGHSFHWPESEYRSFEAGFPFGQYFFRKITIQIKVKKSVELVLILSHLIFNDSQALK